MRALLPLLVLSPLAQDPVLDVEAQPLAAAVRRVQTALELAGAPLEEERAEALASALGREDPEAVVRGVQEVLGPLCLARVHVNPEGRVKVAHGPAPAELMQHGWRVFLVRVHNEAGVTAPLRVTSPNAEPPFARSSNRHRPVARIGAAEVRDRWMDAALLTDRPLRAALSGLELEYRLLTVYSRDAGRREARLTFDIGHGSQDLGFRADLDVLFHCAPAVPVTLDVRDADGEPTTARFVVRDDRGRVYPARARRLAPDFFFHDQVYRADGEALLLPPGQYEVRWTRGPEYHESRRRITVPEAEEHREEFRLERWVHLAAEGWYSGDHHVHAAGCAHYEAPTEGVGPEAMMRHVLGEDLNVGCVLTWGPCWFAQKAHFEGEVHGLSRPQHLMRYDVEVSGFPSSHAGHLCLLGLTEDDYPGTDHPDEWPSWDLPVLRWAREQGAVTGFAHSGWGLEVDARVPPTLEMPRFDGIGANEYVVDVTHGVVDFVSTVDTPAPWELNVWYHVLNCGFRTRISGETDFPCIYGERVGLGRSYVRLDQQELAFEAWLRGLRDGASYVGDGRSHLVDLEVGGLAVGAPGAGGHASVLAATAGEPLEVRARIAALLPEDPAPDLRDRPMSAKPYWHLERARVGDSRRVPVELVVNGQAVDAQELEADGDWRDVRFDWTPERSSWVALRIYPSSHTNPIFVEVDGAPIRASADSARWCAEAVEVCWKAKRGRIRAEERAAARKAYDEAAATYRRILRD